MDNIEDEVDDFQQKKYSITESCWFKITGERKI